MMTDKINRKAILTVTLISSFFNPFMGAAINIALPQIEKELSLNAVSMSWVAMAYLMASAVFLVPAGKLADIIGRKRMFLYGNIVFTLGSLICAVSVNSFMLISFRFVQGLGSAMFFSSAMAIVISAFPLNERGKIIGLSVSAVYLGLTAAPFFGGILTQYLGWRSLFYINFGIELILILIIIFKIKQEWVEAQNENLDIAGSVVYIFSMSSLMYGLSKLPDNMAIILTAIGLTGMVIFVLMETKIKFPVLEIKLFANNRVFAFSNLAALINYAATFAIAFMLSLYLQYVKGLSPRDAGIILMTQPAVMTLTASFSGRLSDRFDSGIIASIGMGIIVIGLVLLSYISIDTKYQYIFMSLVILGLGFGTFSSPNTNSVMSSVEKRYLGVASATVSTMRVSGQMISMAIAAMIIHILIGDAIIEKSNFNLLTQSINILFKLFAGLCLLGVFASLARGKTKIN